jgi:acyl-CoA reductase-like NAD-dependent aldehyde dehydrogenase
MNFMPEAGAQRFLHTIDGASVDSPSHASVIDPATGEAFARAPEATVEQLNAAVGAARRAAAAWAQVPVERRRRTLGGVADVLRKNCRELASIVVFEQGKPMARALDEVERSARQLELLLEIELRDEEVVDSMGRPVRLRWRPLGVVGAITPWNMPLVLLVPKLGHALYTGNAIVVKPSPFTPLSALRLGELLLPLIPRGLVNVVSGDAAIGRLLAEHPDVQKIAFTGSVPTGRKVMASAAANLKRLTLELGGNDAAIVLDDVDPQKVAGRLFAAAFANSGQICMAIKRLYVQDGVYDEICQALVSLARSCRMGAGAAPESQMGPVQNSMQFDILRGLLASVEASGGEILTGGVREGTGGYFVEPAIVTGLREGSRLVDEEQFGPVLPVLRFADEADAIDRANATEFGLGASVWSGNPARAAHVADQLQAGSVWINHHMGSDARIPFGGVKQSGLGRQYGIEGLRSFMEVQAFYAPAPM